MGLFPAWTWVIGLFIGAAIGSFLNVVVYRMPRGLSLSNPAHSFCPRCKARLTALDLFPLLSWLALRGRCRHCRAPVSARYFFVEVVTGALWAAIWHQHLVVGWDPVRALALAAFVSALVAAIYIDLKHFIIPDQVNAAMLVIGLAYNGWLIAIESPRAFTWGVPSAVAGALVGVGVLWSIALLGRLLFGKDAMGHGDIKMARGIGAVLFPAMALASFGIAVLLGAVLGIVQVAARRRVAAPPIESAQEEDEPPAPESIASLVRCGLGYALAIDVIGLFAPRLYHQWFEEDPYAVEDFEEDPEVDLTMIPFGPYLAAGAIVAALFDASIAGLWSAYLARMGLT
jgi:leader peptidase (prepilin peptidase)/N-methyltransferase